MFGLGNKDVKELENRIESLKLDVATAKEELAEVKHQKKMEEEDIKHMVKMKEERLEVEQQKALAKITAEKDEAIAAVKDQYRDKMEKRLQTEVQGMKEMYAQVLERLPNVSARLKVDS